MPDLQESLDLCTYCPKLCSDRCPVSLVTAREAFVPQAKMATLKRLREDGAARATLGTASLYACSGCGACTSACRHHVEPAVRLLEGRVQAQDWGLKHEALRGFREAEGLRIAQVAERILAVAGERARADAEVLYLPACHGTPDEAEADLRQALPLLDAVAAAGEAPVGVAALGCAGYRLYAAGSQQAFRLHAERFHRGAGGAARLVTSCSLCTWLLRSEYPAQGVPLRGAVQHVTEYLAARLEAINPPRRLPAVVYHDPCHLGRRLGVMAPPRRLLERGAERVLEAALHEAEAPCCGAGALLPLTMPVAASAMAAERLRDLAEPGVPIVTACGTCAGQLRGSAGQGPPVWDVLAFLSSLYS